MEKDLLYRLALLKVPGIGPVYAKKLFTHFGSAAAIFHASAKALFEIPGIKTGAIRALTGFKDFHKIESDLAFLEKHRIRILFFTDDAYPKRLVPLQDSPPLLFYRGNADLNTTRIVSIVGTRRPTEYGMHFLETFIRDCSSAGILVVSGLAYGIDTAAHTAALRNAIPTVGVLGHGIKTIYPAQNKPLARAMTTNGGVLTSFDSETGPDECNFPLRNQIVAGICDALLVIESGSRGGSMLTAANAVVYKKRIFALPGRITDTRSMGCNMLIAGGQAALLTDATQFLGSMHWDANPQKTKPAQGSLFDTPAPLSPTGCSREERFLLTLLGENKELGIDQIIASGTLDGSSLAQPLLNLEQQGLIRSLPGRRYRICI